MHARYLVYAKDPLRKEIKLCTTIIHARNHARKPTAVNSKNEKLLEKATAAKYSVVVH